MKLTDVARKVAIGTAHGEPIPFGRFFRARRPGFPAAYEIECIGPGNDGSGMLFVLERDLVDLKNFLAALISVCAERKDSKLPKENYVEDFTDLSPYEERLIEERLEILPAMEPAAVEVKRELPPLIPPRSGLGSGGVARKA